MMKLISRALCTLAAVMLLCPAVKAQQIFPLPADENVRVGKLDNGLTYYIRHNETPKGQADFYIAQKVGSILEEDNQRGLAHFLEHMCFNGTENFPGNQVIDWLESIGVKFGYNLNAYTSVDKTVYNISNVPVARQSVQDSCLLILHDWADGLLLDPEEIDKERGVIHQEWRRSMVGQMRILERLLPVMYPNSRYGERLPIGTMEVVDNFPPQALRDYYETWYRPDQQGVIVVGDIDPDYIEAKIKEYFSPIKMPADPKTREYFPVPDTPGTIYAIGSDPEQTNTIVQIMFKAEALPTELKPTNIGIMTEYMTDMISMMLDQRLTDIGKTPNAPFAQAGADYGNFFLAKTADALSVSGVAKDNDVLPVVDAIYRELLRAVRGGFTVGEYERARAEYMSRLEKAYESRNKTQNETYVHQYVNNFTDNEPMMSIDDEYQLMQMLSQQIPVDYINQVISQMVTPDNRIVLALMPESATIPTEDQIAAVMAAVEAEDIEPYKDEMKAEPLIPQLPAPGKVVSITDNAQWDLKVITLSNGVKVMVKPTEHKPNEILMSAVAIGGTSTVDDAKANELIFMPVAMQNHGLGDYSSTDLERYLQGKQAYVSVSLDDYNTTLNGQTTVKDLPTFMELLYMTFVDFTITPDDYLATQNMYAGVLANQEANPQFIFGKVLRNALFTSAASQSLTADIVRAADRDVMLDIISKQLANAANYTFVFVGDINMDTFIPLLEQYVATLPTSKNVTNNYVVAPGREFPKGSKTTTETTKMETPQTWCMIGVTGTMPYTVENRILANIAGQILTDRLLKTIREEMGAVYSISAASSMLRQGDTNVIIQIPFPMKPELKDEVLTTIKGMVEGMAQEVKPEELKPRQEYLVKNHTEALESNSNWNSAITGWLLNGVDTFNGQDAVVNAVTTADVQNFMRDLINQGNYNVVVLDPAE